VGEKATPKPEGERKIAVSRKGCPPSPQVSKKTNAFLYNFGTGKMAAKQPKNAPKVFRIFERPFAEQLDPE